MKKKKQQAVSRFSTKRFFLKECVPTSVRSEVNKCGNFISRFVSQLYRECEKLAVQGGVSNDGSTKLRENTRKYTSLVECKFDYTFSIISECK